MSEFCRSFLDGDLTRCEELDSLLQPVHDVLFIEVSPSPTKWVLYQMGMIEEGIRLPLLPLSEQNRIPVSKCVAKLGLIN